MEPIAQLHLAAFLCLLSVAISMVTDNPLVYTFVMNPLAIVVGASLGYVDNPRGPQREAMSPTMTQMHLHQSLGPRAHAR